MLGIMHVLEKIYVIYHSLRSARQQLTIFICNESHCIDWCTHSCSVSRLQSINSLNNLIICDMLIPTLTHKTFVLKWILLLSCVTLIILIFMYDRHNCLYARFSFPFFSHSLSSRIFDNEYELEMAFFEGHLITKESRELYESENLNNNEMTTMIWEWWWCDIFQLSLNRHHRRRLAEFTGCCVDCWLPFLVLKDDDTSHERRSFSSSCRIFISRLFHALLPKL